MIRFVCLGVVLLALGACGGGDSSRAPAAPPMAPPDERHDVIVYALTVLNQTDLKGTKGVVQYALEIPAVTMKEYAWTTSAEPKSMKDRYLGETDPVTKQVYRKVWATKRQAWMPDPLRLIANLTLTNLGERALEIRGLAVKATPASHPVPIVTQTSVETGKLLPGDKREFTIELGLTTEIPDGVESSVMLIDVPVETDAAGVVSRRDNLVMRYRMDRTRESRIVKVWVEEDRQLVE